MNDYEEKRAAKIERMHNRAASLAAQSETSLNSARAIGKHDPIRSADPGRSPLRGTSPKGHRPDRLEDAQGLRDGEGSRGPRASRNECRDEHRSVKRRSGSRDQLKEKLAKLAKAQEQMALGNRMIRKGAPAAELATALGLSLEMATKLLEKDFAGRIGFAPYQLSDNSSEIRRCKQRIEQLETKATRPVPPPETYGKITIEESDNRVRVHFPAKPSADTRTALKSAGFKWAPSADAWQRMASEYAWTLARGIVK